MSALLLSKPFAARADWPTNGTYLDTIVGSYPNQVLATDGASGAIVAWLRYDNDFVTDIFAQRVSAIGAVMWTTGGVPVCTALGEEYDVMIATDDDGGAYIAWNDERHEIGCCEMPHVYIQRIDRFGAAIWPVNGIRVNATSEGESLKALVPDGSGGIIVVWSERRDNAPSLIAQRIDRDGNAAWQVDGALACTGCYPDNLVAARDGDGGVVVAWLDTRVYENEIYAQKLNATGVVQWSANGVLLSERQSLKAVPAIASDGNGAAFVTWSDFDDGFYGLIQRIDAAGSITWGPEGMGISNSDNLHGVTSVVSDGTGGAIVLWQEDEPDFLRIRSQRFDSAGNEQWTPNGRLVCDTPAHQALGSAHPDEDGGAVVVWVDFRSTPFVTVTQRLGPGGDLLWDDQGVVLGPSNTYQYGPAAISNGAGGSIIVRAFGSGNTRELRAHGVDANGDSPTGIVDPGAAPQYFGGAYPNPFSYTTNIDVVIPSRAHASIGIFDVRGRKVRALGDAVPDGQRKIQFDGRDDNGRLLPSGVYFLRVRAAGETVTRKLVIAR